jgi:hypothetical protein
MLTAVAVLAALNVVPGSSQAASRPGADVYAVKGTLTVIPKTGKGPGTWSMSGTLSLTAKAGAAPKTGTLTASGLLGPASLPADPCILTATTGALKIFWSAQRASKATVVHVMTHPRHTFLGSLTTGYGKGGMVFMAIRHTNGGGFTGQLVVTMLGPE